MVGIISDFIGMLALMSLLSTAYGSVRRTYLGPNGVEVALGAIYGTIVVLQMQRPFTPIEGVIFDMRAVPLVLAGAFLGMRGVLIAVAMAAIYRAYLGGAGALVGISSILMSGLIGYLWNDATRELPNRTLRHLFGLAAVTSLNLVPILMMPNDIVTWFFLYAAGPIILLYVIFVPFAGLLLERETRLYRLEQSSHSKWHTDPSSGLLSQGGFQRRCAHLEAALPPGAVAGQAIISIRRSRWIALSYGSDTLGSVLGALHVRLNGVIEHDDIVGVNNHRQMMLLLTDDEMRDDTLIPRLKAALEVAEVRLGPREALAIHVTVSKHALSQHAQQENGEQNGQRAVEFARPTERPLFEKAESLMRENRRAKETIKYQ